MLKSFLTIAFRRIRRHRVFSLVNIIGLSLGITSCMFILIYLDFEMSYDNFRPSNIYRIAHHGYQNNVEEGASAQDVPALAPVLKHDLPEVTAASRLVQTAPLMADPVMEVGDKSFREKRIYFADSSFLSLMEYPMVEGRTIDALDGPGKVAISASMASKYFGTTEAVGRTLTFHMGERGATELKVTGVFSDVPGNSHLHTDFIVSFSTLHMDLDNNWDWGNFYTYLSVVPGTDPAVLEQKIPHVLEGHIGREMAEWAKDGYTFRLELQPIRNIHLDSNYWGEAETNGSRNQVRFLAIIAGFILIIAWVNYVNFTIARSAEQVKEIGVRKIAGSNKFQLVGQLLMDAALINATASVISFALIQSLLPLLSRIVGLPLLYFQPWHGIILALLWVVGTLFSGIYPSAVIIRHRTIALLKGKTYTPSFGLRLSKGLVIFQFAVSIVLIVCTVTVYRQLSYMRGHDIGINMDRALVVEGPGIKDSTYQQHLDYFRNETVRLPGVTEMAVSSSVPGQELQWARDFNRLDDPDHTTGIYIVAVDKNFLSLYDATFLAGHNFQTGESDESDAVIFNETAARRLGYTDPTKMIGETVVWNESGQDHFKRRVIGVVKDFHQQSLKLKVEPMVFAVKKFLYAPWANEYYSFRLGAGNLQSPVDAIRKQWSTVFPVNPFDYFFLDNFFSAQYSGEQQFGNVFDLFSALSVIIACLGLFGLSTYVAIRRTKEIGVRKVLGASTARIVRLLSGDFLWWVTIAFVLACPVAWYVMHLWLQQFAYHISPGVWIYVVAGALTLLIALLTVSWQSLKSATRNPTESLRYE